MKNYLFLLILFCNVTFLFPNSNQFLMNSKDFESKLKGATFLGYKNVGFENSESEFSAVFMKANDFLFIRMRELNRFDEYKQYSKNASKYSGLYQIKNHNAAFLIADEVSVLYLEKLNLNCSFEISSKKALTQTELENFVENLGIYNWNSAKKDKRQWAEEIPNEIRLDGNLLEIRKDDAGTDGYQYAYFIKIQFDKDLMKSIDQIIAKFGGNIDLINFKNFTLICSSTDSYDILNKYIIGDPVEFIYYKK